MTGRIVSIDTRMKSSMAMKNRPRIECEHAKRSFDELNYKNGTEPIVKRIINENIQTIYARKL